MDETGGNLSRIEQKLGLDAGTLASKDTLVACIKPEDMKSLRMPTGNEFGANSHWLPGELTSGNSVEATVDTPVGLLFTALSPGG